MIELVRDQVSGKMLFIRKVIGIASWIVVIGTLMYQQFLEKQFLISPRIPNLATGQIFPQLVKGQIFYITSLQQQISGWLPYVQVIALVLLLMAGFRYKSDK